MLFCGRFSGFKANISGPACLVAALIARLARLPIFCFSWPADLVPRPADHEKQKISGSVRCVGPTALWHIAFNAVLAGHQHAGCFVRPHHRQSRRCGRNVAGRSGPPVRRATQPWGTLLLTRFWRANSLQWFLAGLRPARGGSVRRSVCRSVCAGSRWKPSGPRRCISRSAHRSGRSRSGPRRFPSPGGIRSPRPLRGRPARSGSGF